MWVIVLAVILIAVILYSKKNYNQTCKSGSGMGTVVFRFHKPTCPWCVKSKDAWEKFKPWAYKNGINAVEEDITNVKENADKYGVTSVPTVIMVRDGKMISKHEGPRTPEGYINWASQNC